MRPSPFENGVTPLDADNLNERTVYAIGDLDALLTQNKTNLVAAINENKSNIDALPNKWSQSFTVTTVQEFVNAISQIPTGGMGIITIPGGTELVLDRDITITNNKTVLITGYSNSHAKIVFSPYQVDDTYYDYHRFSLGYGANLRFHYIDFELGTPPSDLQPKIKGLINALYSQNVSVVLGACSVVLDGTQHFIESTAYGTALAVGIYGSNITTNGSCVIHNTYRPCMLTKNAVTIDDDTKWVSDSNYLIS